MSARTDREVLDLTDESPGSAAGADAAAAAAAPFASSSLPAGVVAAEVIKTNAWYDEMRDGVNPMDEALIRFNSEQPLLPRSAIEVRLSRYVPTQLGDLSQLGVFATEKIPRGSMITPFGENIIDTKTDHTDVAWSYFMGGSEFDTPGRMVLHGTHIASLFRRYRATTKAGLAAMRKMPAASFLPRAEDHNSYAIEHFTHKSPLGCMINSVWNPVPEQQAAPNVKIRWISGKLQVRHLGGEEVEIPVDLPYFEASRPIKKGEELLALQQQGGEGKIPLSLL